MVAIPVQKKKILITSALPYVNNVPHLGNLIGCVLSADVFARFQRSAGRDTLYICGTDEHGTTTEAKAREEGVTPQEICDKYFAIHKQVYDWFGISFDHFGRTSAPNHVERTQEIFNQLEGNGFILEKTEQQLYSEESKMFLSDRYVEGTCPHCDYEKARGDQCDKCGKLLSPLQLKNPISKIDGAKPIIKETTHLYLDLEKLQAELEMWVATQGELGSWSANALRTTQAWFKEGLQPRAITRDLNWGVRVPKKGFEEKVFYVWFDAPIGYISITEQLLGNDKKGGWRAWWQDPNNTLLYQFMAKDNIPFHTILFPGSLLGTQNEWTLLHHINSTEYLNYEDKKFSKSNSTGVFGDDAMSTQIPADVWRYYLLINRPETADTTFTWDDFQEKLNNELVANIGNLVNRTTTFISRQCEGVITKHGLCEENLLFWEQIQKEEQALTDLLEEVRIKEALKKVMHISRLGNQFFQEQAPWKMIKEDREEAEESLFILVNFVKDLAIMLEPFLPHASASIFKQLNCEQKTWEDLGALSVHGQIAEPELLFTKLEDEELAELKDRFNGNQKKEDIFGPQKLDLRVAKITRVEKHPKADKLYIEHLDVGELGERTIVSGLVPYYSAKELEGKNIIIAANLKPAKLRGVESQGMLLAGQEGDTVSVLSPDAQPGEQVTLEGISHKPAKEITIDEFFSLDRKIENNEPKIAGKRLVCDGKVVKSELETGSLS